MPKQIQPITEQTFEKLKFKYGSVIGENFKLIG
jgi:hypothetical protein